MISKQSLKPFFGAHKREGINSYMIFSKMTYDLCLLWVWITFDAGSFGFNLQLDLILIFLF